MSEKTLREFAATKHKGLPEKKSAYFELASLGKEASANSLYTEAVLECFYEKAASIGLFPEQASQLFVEAFMLKQADDLDLPGYETFSNGANWAGNKLKQGWDAINAPIQGLHDAPTGGANVGGHTATSPMGMSAPPATGAPVAAPSAGKYGPSDMTPKSTQAPGADLSTSTLPKPPSSQLPGSSPSTPAPTAGKYGPESLVPKSLQTAAMGSTAPSLPTESPIGHGYGSASYTLPNGSTKTTMTPNGSSLQGTGATNTLSDGTIQYHPPGGGTVERDLGQQASAARQNQQSATQNQANSLASTTRDPRTMYKDWNSSLENTRNEEASRSKFFSTPHNAPGGTKLI